jgi:amino acid transporter
LGGAISTEKGGPELHRVLGKKDLILLFIVAVANLNLVPSIAASGPITIWLWLAAFVLFFWPQGAAVTELSQRWPGEGGIYLWSKLSFGEKHGFFSGWCYWLTNVFYLPTIVLSCVGVGLYVWGPKTQALANSAAFTGTTAIAVILGLMVLNIRGLDISKWINNIGGAATVAGSAIVCLLALLTAHHSGSALHVAQLKPAHMDWRVIAAFGTICYSLVGLELASIMGDEIQDPKRNLPISILIGGLLAGLIYIGTTASMLVAMPQEQIGILAGILQAINIMATNTGLHGLVAPLALLECLAILGSASAWFAGAARLPFVAGIDRYLPPAIGRVHPKYGTPYVSLILFAVIAVLLTATSFMGVSVNEAYLTLLDLSVILQLVPSLYLYAALWLHAWKNENLQGNRSYLLTNGMFGMVATGVGLCVAFIPQRLVSSIWIFELKLVVGCGVVFGLAYFFYRRGTREKEAAQ